VVSGWRNAWGAVGVLAGLGALVAVPAAVDAALPDEGPVPPGERLDVGFGVSIRPPAGARLDLDTSRPGTGDVVLLVRDLRLSVRAVEVRTRPADFVAHSRDKFSRDEGLRAGEPAAVRTASGVAGQRADLSVEDGALGGQSGCAGIFTAEKAGAVVVVSPVDGCAAVPPDVWAVVESVTFEPVEQW
jgi:hypothetical protein